VKIIKYTMYLWNS